MAGNGFLNPGAISIKVLCLLDLLIIRKLKNEKNAILITCVGIFTFLTSCLSKDKELGGGYSIGSLNEYSDYVVLYDDAGYQVGICPPYGQEVYVVKFKYVVVKIINTENSRYEWYFVDKSVPYPRGIVGPVSEFEVLKN